MKKRPGMTQQLTVTTFLAAALALSVSIQPERSLALTAGRDILAYNAGTPNVRPSSCGNLRGRPTELCLVVLISRHSIRSPLAYTPPADLLTKRPAGWPRWSPPANISGNLSAHGKEVAAAVGAFYRDFYAREQLLPASGTCPAGSDIWVYADTSERTIETADGLIRGLFRGDPSGCGTMVHRTDSSIDAVFKPVQAGSARLNVGQAQREITALAGGPITSLVKRFHGQLATMQRTLDCCQPQACTAAGVPSPCALRDIPTRLVTDRKTGTISLRGGIAIAGGFADDFLLQYAEGMPRRHCSSSPGAPCVGWGQIAPAELRSMLQLYVLKQTIDNRPNAVARASGSYIMRQILGALHQKATTQQRVVVPAAAKFAVFVGHDTNLSNLGGLLRLSWQTSEYPVNTTPPASALIFELRRDKTTGGFVVRTLFLTLTPDQLRNPTTVSVSRPPSRVPLVVAGCESVDCPLARFSSIVSAATDNR